MKRTPTNPHQGSFLFKALSNPREMEHIKERADTIATSCIILRIHNFLSYGQYVFRKQSVPHKVESYDKPPYKMYF